MLHFFYFFGSSKDEKIEMTYSMLRVIYYSRIHLICTTKYVNTIISNLYALFRGMKIFTRVTWLGSGRGKT